MAYCVLCCILVAIVITLSCCQDAVLADQQEGTTPSEESPPVDNATCTSEKCNVVAQSILSGMNKSVDACTDFYAYMCGNWSTNNPMPGEYFVWTTHVRLIEKTLELLRDIAAEPINETDHRTLKLVKTWYQSCMDEGRLKERKLQPIISIINERGGWPIASETWTAPYGDKTLQTLHDGYLRDYSVASFYNILLTPDFENSSVPIITVNLKLKMPLLHLSVRNTIHEDFMDRYIRVMGMVTNQLINETGVNVDGNIVVNEIFQVLVILVNLEAISNRHKDVEAEKMTIQQFQEYYDNGTSSDPNPQKNINWLSAIKYAFIEHSDAITNDTVIEVSQKPGFLDLKNFLGTLPERDFVNYVHWNLIASLLPYTTEEMRQKLIYMRDTLISVDMEPRWKSCIRGMKIKHALAHAYVDRYVNDDVVTKAKDLIEKVQQYFEVLVNETTLLSDVGKEFVRRKLDDMLLLVGYPHWYKTPGVIDRNYETLEIGPDYFNNTINNLAYQRAKGVKNFNRPFNKHNWFQYPTTVNAYYYPQANSIIIPYAFIQELFSDPNVPKAVDYARLGFTLGHEFAHSFLGQGSNFDQYGNSVPSEMNITTPDFQANVTCFVKQYNGYLIDSSNASHPIYLDGNLTRFENMADNLGILIAHAVYRIYKQQTDEAARKLPRLDVSDDQLFFMAFASDWCSAIRPDYPREMMNMDVHSVSKYRIIGALSNLDAFSTAFGCSPTSMMSRPRKCRTL